jgi:hypothetical protein
MDELIQTTNSIIRDGEITSVAAMAENASTNWKASPSTGASRPDSEEDPVIGSQGRRDIVQLYMKVNRQR